MIKELEKEIYAHTIETLARYRRWLEHEYHMDMNDDDVRMRLHSTYWVEDMFPLIFNSKKYSIDYLGDDVTPVVARSAVVLKMYKVLLELRKLTVNGWNLSVAHKVIDDVAHKVFSSDIVYI